MVINNENEIIPYNVFFGEEYPSGEKVLKELTNLLLHDLQEGKVKAIGIAIDTCFKRKNDNMEINAVEIRILEENGHSFNSYVKYWKEDSIIFDDSFTNEPWI